MKSALEPILLCMDMDRTALPNGAQEESPEARERLRRVANRSEVTIAYRRTRTEMPADTEEVEAALAEAGSAADLAVIADLSVSAVSHQLRLLRDRDLVHARRDGRMVYYSLGDDHVSTLMAAGIDHANE